MHRGSSQFDLCTTQFRAKRARPEHMAAWILDVTECPRQQLGIAIETPLGLVVESLLGAACSAYSINPKQLDRLRDHFNLAGVKVNRLDAQVLAESVRLDRHLLREQQVSCSELVQLRDCSRLDAQVKQEKVRLSNQMREVLWSYYPKFIELYGDLSHLWVLQPWKLALTPQKAKRLRLSRVTRILKQHRIRCVDAVTVKKITRCELTVGAPVTKRSDKSQVVIRRRAVNMQLQNAVYHWARVACQHDAVSKAKYKALRGKGHRHTRALRCVADRLLKVTCTMLENQKIFDPDYPTFKLDA